MDTPPRDMVATAGNVTVDNDRKPKNVRIWLS